jgi:hypothetical protein
MRDREIASVARYPAPVPRIHHRTDGLHSRASFTACRANGRGRGRGPHPRAAPVGSRRIPQPRRGSGCRDAPDHALFAAPAPDDSGTAILALRVARISTHCSPNYGVLPRVGACRRSSRLRRPLPIRIYKSRREHVGLDYWIRPGRPGRHCNRPCVIFSAIYLLVRCLLKKRAGVDTHSSRAHRNPTSPGGGGVPHRFPTYKTAFPGWAAPRFPDS